MPSFPTEIIELESPQGRMLEKTLRLGKIEGKRRRQAAEVEMIRWHHRLNGHESEQTLGGSEGQGSLVWCSPLAWGESDTA